MTADTETFPFRKKKLGEPLAQYLHDMADLFGADVEQRRLLSEAAAMSHPQRTEADRAWAKRMAMRIREELQSGIDAVVYAAQARGEKVEVFNDDGAVCIKGRDGLYSLIAAGSLTEAEANTAIAYRALFESCGYADLGSQLGRVSGQPGSQRTSTASMHLSKLNSVYASVQLVAADAAVGSDLLPVLRAVAGEGRTLRSLRTSGRHGRKLLSDLVEALRRVRISMAETGGLRIRDR